MRCVLGALHATLPAFASSASHIYARKVIMPLSPYNANFVLTKTILLLDLICMHTYLRDLKAISRIWWKWWLMYWIHVTFERERVWLATAKMQYIHAAYYIAIVLQFLAMIIVVGTHTHAISSFGMYLCESPTERATVRELSADEKGGYHYRNWISHWNFQFVAIASAK